MYVTQLSCFFCHKEYAKQQVHNLCLSCGKPLKVEYDLAKIGQVMSPEMLVTRPATLWRYREVLPVEQDSNIVSLGEGFTPLLTAANLGASRGLKNLFIKDDALNPTGSFKSRGMAVAVSMAKELGIKKLAIPTAGNAGGALAAYAAKAQLPAFIFMPQDAPLACRLEVEIYGAELTLVDGLINTCAKIIGERKQQEGWFDVSTLKEPYRLEGKKTMGYELAEQLDWQLPDVIIYPVGGGTGLIGMWKAFEEMAQLGWVTGKRPRMVAVQAVGCAPIVRAFQAQALSSEEFKNAHTSASGLRVPHPIGDFIILNILYQSQGFAIEATDEEILKASREIGAKEGLFVAPEGGATLVALDKLLQQGQIQPHEKVVLYNTGSGTKYLEAFANG